MDGPDWTLIRSFLAVAVAGSLSAAARTTGHSQPTLGRHIKALERGLGCALFLRTATGQTLTDAGRDLLPLAREMRDAAARLTLTAAARTPGLSGTVRVTASRVVAHHLLPPILAALHERAPAIEVELVATDTTDNLLFAEADIALRMYRPTQPDLITRHLADLPMRLYAARDVLDRLGQPQDAEALLAMPFVGFDRNDMILRLMATFGVQRTRHDFAFRCDDQLVFWNLVRAGCGVGAMLAVVGDADPEVRAVAPFVSLPPLPMWITTSAPLAHNARLSLVWDHLATALRRLVA